MKKFYEEPEMTVRNYVLPPSDVVTTSGVGGNEGGNGGSLEGGDEYDPFKTNYFE